MGRELISESVAGFIVLTSGGDGFPAGCAWASVTTFAATNIDDICLLTIFFFARRVPARRIVAGQYLGFVEHLDFLSCESPPLPPEAEMNSAHATHLSPAKYSGRKSNLCLPSSEAHSRTENQMKQRHESIVAWRRRRDGD